MSQTEFLVPGLQSWRRPDGIRVLRLHYSADPEKTPEWASAQKALMTDPSLAEQEYEISFHATLGQLLYRMDDEATLEPAFPIPQDWTRYWALDPHPVVPHCALWGAVDRWGDLWIYREYWPSKIYAEPGLDVPEDDNRISVRQYLEVVQWYESEKNPDNQGKAERIYKRVIDYSARAFGKGTSDDPEQPNFQQRFEMIGDELGLDMRFEDSKKDRGVGEELVNEWLRPREVEIDGKWRKRSRLHIFQDRCPELIWQLRNNRRKTLTPQQAEFSDPTGKAILKRKHASDDLMYMIAANPEYVSETKARSTTRPLYPGVSY